MARIYKGDNLVSNYALLCDLSGTIFDGSPRGVFDNLEALQTAYPSGASGVYLTSDNGHWYYWNGLSWTDGGVYYSSDDVNQLKEDLINLDKGIILLSKYGNFVQGNLANGVINKDIKWRVSTDDIITADRDLTISISDDFRIGIHYFVDGVFSLDTGWITDKTYIILKDKQFKIVISKISAETSHLEADVNEFLNAVTIVSQTYEAINNVAKTKLGYFEKYSASSSPKAFKDEIASGSTILFKSLGASDTSIKSLILYGMYGSTSSEGYDALLKVDINNNNIKRITTTRQYHHLQVAISPYVTGVTFEFAMLVSEDYFGVCDDLLSKQNYTFSVLGDSWSTFKGYMNPPTNTSWYPSWETDVQGSENDVELPSQIWWNVLAQNSKMKIIENNAYSGSPISYDGYGSGNDDAKTYSFITRMKNMIGGADLYIIEGGTNDSFAGVELGDYKYSRWVESDFSYFKPSLCYMIDYFLNRHPNSKLLYIINDDISTNYKTAIIEACNYYSVPYVELSSIAKEKGHPTIAGQNRIAELVYSKVKEMF